MRYIKSKNRGLSLLTFIYCNYDMYTLCDTTRWPKYDHGWLKNVTLLILLIYTKINKRFVDGKHIHPKNHFLYLRSFCFTVTTMLSIVEALWEASQGTAINKFPLS